MKTSLGAQVRLQLLLVSRLLMPPWSKPVTRPGPDSREGLGALLMGGTGARGGISSNLCCDCKYYTPPRETQAPAVLRSPRLLQLWVRRTRRAGPNGDGLLTRVPWVSNSRPTRRELRGQVSCQTHSVVGPGTGRPPLAASLRKGGAGDEGRSPPQP